MEDCQVEMKNQRWTYCTTRQYRLSINSRLPHFHEVTLAHAYTVVLNVKCHVDFLLWFPEIFNWWSVWVVLNRRVMAPLYISKLMKVKLTGVLEAAKCAKNNTSRTNQSWLFNRCEQTTTKLVLHIHTYTVFRKKHPLLFSCITLRKSNQFEWKFQTQ